MHNERGAGRKPRITNEQLNDISRRIESGDSVASIAREYGVSRQALFSRLKSAKESKVLCLDYYVDDTCVTKICINTHNKSLKIINQTDRLAAYAFGLTKSPTWDDFGLFLENLYLQGIGIYNNDCIEADNQTLWVQDRSCGFSLADVLKNFPDRLKIAEDEDAFDLPVFNISKQNIIYFRTDTDGYQCKALSRDRKWFIKAQATISGRLMNDWNVEIIASDLCKQLGIQCVEQRPCEVVYGANKYKAVYSRNFELEGYEFVSFERLLERMGVSKYDQEFIRADAIFKLEWCAKKLSIAGDISYEATLKYMIDLALIDCLVGNVDRHMKNFGLFYDFVNDSYKLPLIFDNGMGLFEHEVLQDLNISFDMAMRTVYVSPYGEDPFDMIRLLNDRYKITELYPNLKSINYIRNGLSSLANEYINRMFETVISL